MSSAEFWAAAAAVAPVIALSATVVAGDSAKQVVRYEKSLVYKSPSFLKARRWAGSAYIASGGNMAAQAGVLAFSLISLSDLGDATGYSQLLVTVAETIGIMGIFFATIFNALSGLAISRSPIEERKSNSGTNNGTGGSNDE
jgi:hypothetical protein